VLNALKQAPPNNAISPTRHRIYGELFAELSQTRY
jgi:hypothetical protein